MVHPTFSELIDYLQRQLSIAAHQEVENHVATCGECQHTLEIARQTLGQPQSDALVAPPGDLLRRAVAAFRRRQSQVAQRLQVAVALQFDNFAHAGALGTRGGSKERQLLYTFDEFDLDLQIGTIAPPNIWTMRGQLLTHTPLDSGLAGITIQLTRDHHTPWLRLTDDSGIFSFSRLLAGTYSLHILLERRAVLIEPLALPG